jgi:hypothetical protein
MGLHGSSSQQPVLVPDATQPPGQPVPLPGPFPPWLHSPLKAPSASYQSGVGTSAGGSLRQCTRSVDTTWSQHSPQYHWQLERRCWKNLVEGGRGAVVADKEVQVMAGSYMHTRTAGSQ